MLENKNIALYVTGGIAIYKAVDLMRDFIKRGAKVRVAMTESATEFVTPLTFQILSQHEVHIDTFSEKTPGHVSHVDLADWSDVAVVAPATANTIAKMANGMADNFVTSSLLATDAPIFIVAAMNTDMYQNSITQENIQRLVNRGIYVVEPDTGFLAEGYEGKGRYPENTRIIDELEQYLVQNEEFLPLRGYKVLVSAGGTKERIDPVRYITNDSSGKTGHAIAESAYKLGAEVTLVTTSQLPASSAIHKIPVESAKEMYHAIDDHFEETDILIMSAAVSDYGVAEVSDSKMKKDGQSDDLRIDLVENPDILKTMGEKKSKQFLVGFAAETDHLEEYAKKKLVEKNLDLIVANEVGRDDRGFNVDDNAVTIFSNEHHKVHVPKTSKKNIANILMAKIISELGIDN